MFIHYFTPSRIIFSLGPINIYWYGLIIALAILLCLATAIYLLRQRGDKSEDIYELTFWTVIGAVIGARLYDVLVVDWVYFSRQPQEIIAVWQGGMAIHGAIIGGVLVLALWCWRKKQAVWPWLDLSAVVLPLGQALGRFGNWFNQELFGRPTNLPWGIPIPESLRPEQYLSSQYFQPLFLYESLLSLGLFSLLFFSFKKKLFQPGQYLALYLAGYGLIRFVMEFLRFDATAMIFGFRWPQVFSLALIIIGLAIFWRKKKDA
ncbi:MAG: prolipoprotein diacylglyceryl transferase [Patescibacteria group bacterium]|jgi:phosphatidylglycerol:prolipoprotein diacylglycerol transferase